MAGLLLKLACYRLDMAVIFHVQSCCTILTLTEKEQVDLCNTQNFFLLSRQTTLVRMNIFSRIKAVSPSVIHTFKKPQRAQSVENISVRFSTIPGQKTSMKRH